jgi:hypothetical protein
VIHQNLGLVCIYPFRVLVKGPEAKLKGGCEDEGAFAGTLILYIDYQLIWRGYVLIPKELNSVPSAYRRVSPW